MSLLLLSVDGVDATQRSQIQTLIENESSDWWHRQRNLWIFESDEPPGVWRDRLTPVIHNPGASVLVVNLKPETVSRIAVRRVGGVSGLGVDWLYEKLGFRSSAPARKTN